MASNVGFDPDAYLRELGISTGLAPEETPDLPLIPTTVKKTTNQKISEFNPDQYMAELELMGVDFSKLNEPPPDTTEPPGFWANLISKARERFGGDEDKVDEAMQTIPPRDYPANTPTQLYTELPKFGPGEDEISIMTSGVVGAADFIGSAAEYTALQAQREAREKPEYKRLQKNIKKIEAIREEKRSRADTSILIASQKRIARLEKGFLIDKLPVTYLPLPTKKTIIHIANTIAKWTKGAVTDEMREIARNAPEYLSTGASWKKNPFKLAHALLASTAESAPMTIASILPFAQVGIIASEGGRWLDGINKKYGGDIDDDIKRKFSTAYGIPSGLTEFYMNRIIIGGMKKVGLGNIKPVKALTAKATDTVFKKITKKALAMAGVGIGEGFEELTQDGLDDLMNVLAIREQAGRLRAKGKSAKAKNLVDRMKADIKEQFFSKKAKSFLLGTLIGTTMRGGTMITSTVGKKLIQLKTDRQEAKRIDQLTPEQRETFFKQNEDLRPRSEKPLLSIEEQQKLETTTTVDVIEADPLVPNEWVFKVEGRAEERITLEDKKAELRKKRPAMSEQDLDASVDEGAKHPVSGLPSLAHLHSWMDNTYRVTPNETNISHFHKGGDEAVMGVSLKAEDKHEAVITNMDMNFMAAINETPGLGHDVADQMQRKLQNGITNYLAKDATLAEAKTLGDKVKRTVEIMKELKNRINAIPVLLPNGKRINIGLSFGIGVNPQTAEDALNEGKERLGGNSIAIDQGLLDKYGLSEEVAEEVTDQYLEAGLKSKKLEAERGKTREGVDVRTARARVGRPIEVSDPPVTIEAALGEEGAVLEEGREEDARELLKIAIDAFPGVETEGADFGRYISGVSESNKTNLGELDLDQLRAVYQDLSGGKRPIETKKEEVAEEEIAEPTREDLTEEELEKTSREQLETIANRLKVPILSKAGFVERQNNAIIRDVLKAQRKITRVEKGRVKIKETQEKKRKLALIPKTPLDVVEAHKIKITESYKEIIDSDFIKGNLGLLNNTTGSTLEELVTEMGDAMRNEYGIHTDNDLLNYLLDVEGRKTGEQKIAKEAAAAEELQEKAFEARSRERLTIKADMLRTGDRFFMETSKGKIEEVTVTDRTNEGLVIKNGKEIVLAVDQIIHNVVPNPKTGSVITREDRPMMEDDLIGLEEETQAKDEEDKIRTAERALTEDESEELDDATFDFGTNVDPGLISGIKKKLDQMAKDSQKAIDDDKGKLFAGIPPRYLTHYAVMAARDLANGNINFRVWSEGFKEKMRHKADDIEMRKIFAEAQEILGIEGKKIAATNPKWAKSTMDLFGRSEGAEQIAEETSKRAKDDRKKWEKDRQLDDTPLFNAAAGIDERQTNMFTSDDTKTQNLSSEAINKLGKPADSYVDELPLGLSIKDVSKRPDDELSVPESFVKSTDPEVAKRMDAARKPTPSKMWRNIKEGVEGTIQSFTRHHIHLDPIKDGAYSDILRRWEAVGTASKAAAQTILHGITHKMGKVKYELFSNIIITEDLMKDVERGLYQNKDLPFGWKSYDAMKSDYDRWVNAMAEDKNKDVKEALEKRKEAMNMLRQDLVKNKLLSEKVLADDRYFHHQVLQYMDTQRFLGVGSRDVRVHTKGYQLGRTGFEGDYSTNYLESEFQVIAQAITQLETKKTLEQIRKIGDIGDELKREARKLNEENVTKKLIDDGTYTLIYKTDPFRKFRQKLGFAIGELQKMAKKGELKATGFGDMIARLKGGRVQTSEDNNRFHAFLGYLLDQNLPGANFAATYYKGIAEKNQFIKDKLGNKFIKWQDIIPDGYRKWQPKLGLLTTQMHTISDRIMDQVFKGQKILTEEDVQERRVVLGERPSWVIPENLAMTMDNMEKKGEDIAPMAAARFLNRKWKIWTLLNPLSWTKYGINNMSGDLDIVLTYNPKILTGGYLKGAFKDLWAYNVRRQAPTAEILEAIKLGVVDSGFSVSEIGGVSEEETFDFLMGPDPSNWSKVKKLPRHTWEKMKNLQTLRENYLRLAAFRFFKDQLAQGHKMYGASKKTEIDDMIKKRLPQDQLAAKLGRELIGDYGNISKAGQMLRNTLIPFYSWMEINSPRYYRLLKNLPHDTSIPGSRGKTVAKIAGLTTVRAGSYLATRSLILYGLANIWNKMFFPEEEEELGKNRRQLHLILGRYEDGSIKSLRFQGALSDVLSWVGLEDLPYDIKDVATGRATIGEKVIEGGKAFTSKLANSVTPFLKVFGEVVTRRSIYPDMYRPRFIRDITEHAMRAVRMDLPYKLLRGRPISPAHKSLGIFLLYRTEPHEAGYWETNELVSRYAKRNDMDIPTGGIYSEKSNALYYYKKALSYGDAKTAKRYYDEYIELGGKRKGIRRSIESTKPLRIFAGKNWKHKRKFLDELNVDDLKVVRRAYVWWYKVYKGKKDGIGYQVEKMDKLIAKKQKEER